MFRFLVKPLLLLLSLACSGQEVAEVDWASDIAHIKKQLPLLHKDFDKLIHPDSFVLAMDRILQKYPDGGNYEPALEIQKVLASLGVAHTGIPFYHASVLTQLPVYLEYFDDGLFITAMPLDEENLSGSRITGIGGFPLDSAHRILSGFISHENEQWVRNMMPLVMKMPQLLYHEGLSASTDSITYKLEGGRELQLGPEPDWLKMSGKTGLSMPWLQYQAKAYWFEARDKGILRIVYNSCKEDNNYPFAQFCTDVRGILDSGSVYKVLVDLRWNGGGNSEVFKPMLKVLKDFPDIPCYTAISKRTFSSGLFAARDMKRELRAPLLGQATGGAPTGYGETHRFQAPSSRMPISYCVKYFDWPEYPGNTMEPDVAIAYTSEDFFSGRDPVLDYLLSIQ